MTTIPATLQGTKISVGTLTFKQDPDGNISITGYDKTTPADKMKIDYVIQEKVEASELTKINEVNYTKVVEDMPTKDIFNTKTNILFTQDVDNKLAVFENNYYDLYRQFMEESLDGDVDDLINEDDYSKAFGILKEIFNKNTAYKNIDATTDASELGKFKAMIISCTDPDEQTFIVDKCKAIFSYDVKYTK